MPIPVLAPPSPAFVYPQHEQLVFNVDWRVFTGGIAKFTLDQSNGALKISATADTVGAVNMLFAVVDKFQSGFDLKTGCSTGFSKQIQEGHRKIDSDLMLDYAHGKQIQNERNLVKGTATHSPPFFMTSPSRSTWDRPSTSRWRTACAPSPWA
jgi:hypothetical protein